MLKTFVIALVIALLKFQLSLGEMGQMLEFKPTTNLLKGTSVSEGKFQLANRNDAIYFPKDKVFQYRYHPEEDDYVSTPYDEIPLRRVEKQEDDGTNINVIYTKLIVNVEDIEGTCVSQHWEDWTLRLPKLDDNKAEMNLKFPDGKILKSIPTNFKFDRWDGLRDVVLSTKEFETRGTKKATVLHVHLTSCKLFTVYKNGENTPFKACHISKHSTMVFLNNGDEKEFKIGDLFQYKSDGEPVGKTARALEDNPLRRVKSYGSVPNTVIFDKIEVKLTGEKYTDVEGSLFSKESDSKCVIEVIKTGKQDPSTIFMEGLTFTLKWNCEKPKQDPLDNHKYTVLKTEPIKPDGFTNKDGLRVTFKVEA